MQSSIRHSGNIIHSNKNSCNMFIISLTEIKVAELKMDKMTYLKMKSFHNQLRHCNVPPNHKPTSSLISQQCCHPRVGNDSPRNKGTTGLHVAKDTQNTQTSQQSWVYQAIKDLEKENC